MTVLVIGATGRVAAPLTRRLREDDLPVRALVRNYEKARQYFADPSGTTAGLEIVSGAFEDPAVLNRAFGGVDAAFLALGTSLEQITLEKGLIDAAARAGLQQLVRLSVLGPDSNGIYEVARRHAEIDDYLAASGVPRTLLRPAYFSSNLLSAAQSIANSDRWSGTAPDGLAAIIDARDVADAAAAVIENPALQNTAHDLTGPESLSFPDVADRFSAVLGRRISYIRVDEATARRGLSARGVPDWLADIAIGIDAAMQAGLHAKTTDRLQQLTGKPPRTVDDFIRDHGDRFIRAADASSAV